MARCTLLLTGIELDMSSPSARNAARHFVADLADRAGAAEATFRFGVDGPNVQKLDLKRYETEVFPAGTARAFEVDEPAAAVDEPAAAPALTEGGDRVSSDQPPVES